MIFPRSRSSAIATYSLIIVLMLAHLPFLPADPDVDISFSRGPFTDEGQNTVQVRNWLNHGKLDISESDNLLKTPLFGFSLTAPYAVFGTRLIVSRLWVLSLVIISFLVLARTKEFREILILLILLVMFKYQLFQFSHFSLAEILSVMSITLSVFFFARSASGAENPLRGIKLAAVSALFLSMSYFFKIQFIYILPLLPLLTLEKILSSRGSVRRFYLRQSMAIFAVMLFFLLAYLLAWYLPHKETYDFMMVHQSGAVSLDPNTMETIRFNLRFFFFTGLPLLYTLIFLACLVTGTIFLFRKTGRYFRTLFLGSLIWFILELHKLAMVYLPTRYQVSLYFAMGLLMAIVLAEILQARSLKLSRISPGNVAKYMAAAAIMALFSLNLADYHSTLQRRHYTIRELNRYLSRQDLKNDLVIGAWAPSLTWDCKSRSFPVWNGFLNYQDPVRKLKPRVIISEPDEKDSEQAYRSQGIDLMEISDSVKISGIGKWTVGIYWLKDQ